MDVHIASVRRALHVAAAGILLAGSFAGGSRASSPLESVSVSPDVTVVLGIVAPDESVMVDNLLGMIAPANLGTLPEPSDVSGYELLSDGDRLLCFDTVVELSGPVVAGPGDVVRYDGSTYSIEFDASANGVPDGVRCDAVTVDDSGELVLSFDVGVELPGNVFIADEDLVRVDGPSSFTLLLDGDDAAVGIPTEADVDGAHLLSNGSIAVSLDVATSVGGVQASDEDVLEYDPVAETWSLAFDGSTQHATLASADVDAVALPEPQVVTLLGAGMLAMVAIVRHRRRATA